MFKAISLLLVGLPLIQADSADAPYITNIQDMIKYSQEIANIAMGNTPFEDLFDETKNPFTPISETIEQIFSRNMHLEKNLADDLEYVFIQLLKDIPLTDGAKNNVKTFAKHIHKMVLRDRKYHLYSSNMDTDSKDEIEIFALESISQKAGGTAELLNRLYTSVVPSKSSLVRNSLWAEIRQQANNTAAIANLCDLDISFQHRLLKLYTITMIIELKAFAITMFSYKFLSGYKNESFNAEVKQNQIKFVMRTEQYMLELIRVFNGASRDIYRCDPKTHIFGENYIELEGLFMAIVINEFLVKTDGLCSGTCGELPKNSNRDNCYDRTAWDASTNKFCVTHPCNGPILNCEWIGGYVDICEYPKSSRKRYEYVRSYSLGYFSEWTQCKNATYLQTYSFAYSWYNCGVCICNCKEENANSPAIRSISLMPQISNIEENKVLSDVRFVLKNKMIQLQIEQCPLKPACQLDKLNASWVPLAQLNYTSYDDTKTFVRISGDEEVALMEGHDFAYISDKQKILNIDEISAGPDYIVTGARINYETKSEIEAESSPDRGPLQLEIYVTPFDHKTGKLTPTSESPSKWLTPKTQPKIPKEYAQERLQVKMGDYIYKAGTSYTIPDTRPNQYVEFRQSSIRSDAGQSTIPFFDSRPVATLNHEALGGLGLMFRSSDKYTGIIALKALSIHLTHFQHPKMTKEQTDYYMRAYRKPTPHGPMG